MWLCCGGKGAAGGSDVPTDCSTSTVPRNPCVLHITKPVEPLLQSSPADGVLHRESLAWSRLAVGET